MSCTAIRADLIAACTGDLDAALRRVVEAHLAACDACRGEAAVIDRVLGVLTPEAVFPREREVDWSTPLTCTAVRRAACIDGAATPDDDVRAHIARCDPCRDEAEIIARTLGACTPEVVFPRESEIDWSTPLTCTAVRAELSSVLEVDSPGRDRVLDHLARCPACTEESSAIGETLLMARRARPEEERVDWDAFARETARLAQRQARLTPAARSVWRVRAALPMAASLLAAVGLAWLAARAPVPPTGAPPQIADSRPVIRPDIPGTGATPLVPTEEMPSPAQALLARARVELAKDNTARYLADSGNLLLGLSAIAARCDGNNVDISVERELSTRLLKRKQFLQGDLRDVEVVRAQRLADEIEDLLIDVASLEPCTPPQRVLELRDRMRDRQLMMRIQMISNELQQGGRRA